MEAFSSTTSSALLDPIAQWPEAMFGEIDFVIFRLFLTLLNNVHVHGGFRLLLAPREPRCRRLAGRTLSSRMSTTYQVKVRFN